MVRYLLLLLAAAAIGQNYDFSIPSLDCIIEVQPDRSLLVQYDIVFQTTPGYSPVDIVDIGFPSEDFRIEDITAELDGFPLTGIYSSTVIDNGVEVHLRGRAIPGGKQAHFRLSALCRNMVFLDSGKDDFASVEFTPTWFDGSLLTGYTDYTVSLIFPPGATSDMVRHHELPFTDSRVDENGRVIYSWKDTRRADGPFLVGVSFPADLVEGPLTERPSEPLISKAALAKLVIFGIFFIFFALIVLFIVISIRKARRRREQYLPPGVGIEGSGIKRGLTAPMAALLLELKLDRVFMMIIFGLLKKGCLVIEDGKLIKTGDFEGLRSYEKEILRLIPKEGLKKPIAGDEVRKVFMNMILDLQTKMTNYSLKETQEYYRSIIKTAWRMVRESESARKAGEILDARFQWLLAEGMFDKFVREIPEGRTVMLPRCMNFIPVYRGSAGKGGISLSEACSQAVGVLESAAGKTVSSITNMSRSVTASTNPVPVSTGRSSGSGCACACACAGCACACAGGGR